MEENKPGKRLAQGEGMTPGAKRGMIVVAAVVVALLAVYLGLCAWVSSYGPILPRVSAAGVDLGGLTWQEAQATLEGALADRFSGASVNLTVPGTAEAYPVSGTLVSVDAGQAAIDAANWGHTGGFFAQGGLFLATLVTGHEVPLPAAFTPEGDAQVDALLRGIEDDLGGTVVETTWDVSGDDLVFHMGTPGRAFDLREVKDQILDRFATGSADPVELTAEVTAPAAVDLAQVHSQVATKVKDASLDPETFEVSDSVRGLDFNAADAQSALEGAAWGSDVRIPLDVTEPKVSAESLRELLFRDVLGEASSKVGGSANRKSNVKLSAAACNEKVLLPGDVFSYNTATGSRNAANGYLPAPAYVGGKSVDELGGGICQTSSTIYYAALNSNLKIVERHNHMFAVGYVPDGMDATVYYGSSDFLFENDTDYPIKIVTNYEKSRLTVTIYGTKTDELTVKMTNEVYDWTPYTTVYKIDPNLAPGSAPKEEQNGYTGRKAKTYRNLYNAEGELVSSTLETTNTYKTRERILLVSPADAAQYGLAADGTALPPATATPVPSETLPVETTPVPGESPAPTESAPVTEAPAPTPAPGGEPPAAGGTEPAVSAAPTPEQPPVSAAPAPEPTPVPTPAPEDPNGPPAGIPT